MQPFADTTMTGGVIFSDEIRTKVASGNWILLLDLLERAALGGLVHANWRELVTVIAEASKAAGVPATAGLSTTHAQHLATEMLAQLGVLPAWLAAAMLHYKIPHTQVLRDLIITWFEYFVDGRVRAWPRRAGDHVRAYEEQLFVGILQTFGPQNLFSRCWCRETPARAAAVANKLASATAVRGLLAPYARADVIVARPARTEPATPMEF